jgi:hypothetical protein
MMTSVETVQVFKKLLDLGFKQNTFTSNRRFQKDKFEINLGIADRRIIYCEFSQFENLTWVSKASFSNPTIQEIYTHLIAIFNIQVETNIFLLRFEKYYNEES